MKIRGIVGSLLVLVGPLIALGDEDIEISDVQRDQQGFLVHSVESPHQAGRTDICVQHAEPGELLTSDKTTFIKNGCHFVATWATNGKITINGTKEGSRVERSIWDREYHPHGECSKTNADCHPDARIIGDRSQGKPFPDHEERSDDVPVRHQCHAYFFV